MPARVTDGRGRVAWARAQPAASPVREGTTILYGPVVDQAALHGLLRTVRDPGLPLISVTHAQTGQADGPDVKQSIEASTLERNQDGGN